MLNRRTILHFSGLLIALCFTSVMDTQVAEAKGKGKTIVFTAQSKHTHYITIKATKVLPKLGANIELTLYKQTIAAIDGSEGAYTKVGRIYAGNRDSNGTKVLKLTPGKYKIFTEGYNFNYDIKIESRKRRAKDKTTIGSAKGKI